MEHRNRSSKARRRRRGGNALARTILLGFLACAAGFYYLAVQLGIDRRELLGHLASSAVMIGVIVVGALVLGGLIYGLRVLWQRRSAGATDRSEPTGPADQ